MRVLTQKIIDMHVIPICQSGQEFVDGANVTGYSLIGKTPEEVMEVVEGEETTEEIVWWRMLFKQPEVIREWGALPDGHYRITGHGTDSSVIFATLEEAQQAHNDACAQWKIDFSHTISTVISTTDVNGNALWTPIDLLSYTVVGDEVFKVFNTTTGLYEDFNSLDDAKIRFSEFLDRFESTAHSSCHIQQRITNSQGDVAWETL